MTSPVSPPPTIPRPSWWHSPMRPAATVRQFDLGERSILFCERQQQLFELNDSAAILWQAAARGLPADRAAERLTQRGVMPDQAAFFAENAMTSWLEKGLLTPEPLAELDDDDASHRLSLAIGPLTCRLDIHGDANAMIRQMVVPIFSQFSGHADAPSEAPVITMAEEGDAWFLLSDGLPIGLYSADRIVAELKAHLTSRLAQSVINDDALLHTAMLSRKGRGVLLHGSPGAGKTTLTLGLVASGWAYASDDIVHFSVADGFAGIPFSPAAKAGSWPLLDSLIPALRALPIHLRRDEQRVRYIPIDRFARCTSRSVEWGFLLSRREGVAATIEPVEPLHFLSEMLGGAFSARHHLRTTLLAALIDHLAVMNCRRLIYSDLPSAIALLEDIVGG